MPPHLPDHGHHRLRLGRRSEAGRSYHLTVVTHERQPLFAQWPAASCMCRLLTDPGCWPGARLLAWVLMPDHWHGLATLGDHGSLSSLMNRAKGRTARGFNQEQQRSGPVWAAGFHDRAIRRNQDMRAVARYLVANPVRAGLVRQLGDYPCWDATWIAGPDVL